MRDTNPLMPSRKASRPAILGWLLFDWACQPFFTLVTTFVFAPYFASALAPDPVTGQSLWGYATAAAGLVLAVLSPVLGSIADATGPKKPWIATCGLVLFAASFALWYAAPGQSHAIAIALVGFAFGTVAVEVAAVFNNAMIPHLVPPERYGRLSGTGWAMGYCGGLVSLVIVLGFLAADPVSMKTVFGLDPLFGLDPAMREGDRITGPFSALWFLLFVLPLFLFTPDIPRSAMSFKQAARTGIAQVKKHHRRCAPPRERRPLSRRQHGLSGCAGGALRLRRHLRRRRVRLAGDRARDLRHPAHHHRHARARSSAGGSTTASAPSP